MRLVLLVKGQELYSQNSVKYFPGEHRNFHHYLALLCIFQKLLVMNIGSYFFFRNPPWYFTFKFGQLIEYNVTYFSLKIKKMRHAE